MKKPSISIEFFPPQTEEGAHKLSATVDTLQADLQPEFFSVTYGAGGSTQERSFATVKDILGKGLAAAPHLSCVGSRREQIAAILDDYRQQNIRHIVALRGDLPSGVVDPGELRHANELVEFIRQHSGDWFHISVAAYPEFHPQASSPADDLQRLKQKLAAGATDAITQYFFNIEAFLRFRDDCIALQITAPIIPGIMPINNFSKLARFSDACGAEIPRWMRLKFGELGDDGDAVKKLGEDIVTQLCQRLLTEGVPGLHFYSMNQATQTIAICRNIGFI